MAKDTATFYNGGLQEKAKDKSYFQCQNYQDAGAKF